MLHPMGGRQARAGKAVGSLLVGSLLSGLPLRRRLASRTGLEARHSGWVARFGLAFQLGNPPLQPLNHRRLRHNDRLLLGDDGDENIAAGGSQVKFGVHPY